MTISRGDIAYYLKPFVHIGLIVMLLGFKSFDAIYQKRIIISIFICMFADLALSWNENSFVVGMILFLIGHIGFITSYLKLNKKLDLWLLLLFILWSSGLLFFLWNNLNDFKIPVTVYATVISLMMWRAASNLSQDFQLNTLLAMVGAILFAFSDSIIAINKFYTELSFSAQIIIIVTYWLALLLIAISSLSWNKVK
ncbi:MAG: lysoplasmalogenase [Saprospiraceae bacterium]|nr:lysoplasmalogenase [Saprospiraceae bacterium]